MRGRTDARPPEALVPARRGEPFRYTAEIEFLGKRVTRKFGVRKVAVDQSEHPVEGTYFILEINNRRIFCKGGNFVPADLYYSEVDAGRCRELVRLAAGANFNLLRIWGGGIYATEELCDACDEAGIMLWHDFIFACAKYPGENEAFSRAVRKEALTVVRALNHHPSLVVWCGNNELELGNRSWRQYCDCEVGWSDHYIFHHLLAKVVHDESPQVFYWPSSPYSPGFKEPVRPDHRRPASVEGDARNARRHRFLDVPHLCRPFSERGGRSRLFDSGDAAAVPAGKRAGTLVVLVGSPRQSVRAARGHLRQLQPGAAARPRLRDRRALDRARPADAADGALCRRFGAPAGGGA